MTADGQRESAIARSTTAWTLPIRSRHSTRKDTAMKSQLPWYALAVAIVVVGLAALKVPLTTLLVPLAVLACPLMMIFMMRGMHGGDERGRDENAGFDRSSDGPPVHSPGDEEQRSASR
jgi:hypothetical protein